MSELAELRDQALFRMREALSLLDGTGEHLAAAHLQAAIDVADPISSVSTDDDGVVASTQTEPPVALKQSKSGP